ncbi:MAG: glycoside hydrolase family 25 protein [Patescibacteria group bacterium]|nr:glycoside hydrolase family 25 protein [Patescibacteria group bacterium]
MFRQINVVDMYHGNSAKLSDFAAMKAAGLYAVVHKASQGSHYVDPMYAARKDAAIGAGLLWGAYHFLDSSDVSAQVDNFLNASEITAPGADPFLVACDYEDSANAPTLQQCYQFMAQVDRATPPGVACLLYSGNRIRETLKPNPGGHQDQSMVGVETFFQQHRLWLAEYGPKENVPWPWNSPIVKSSDQATHIPAPGVFLWQFTESGRFNPLPGMTDGNFFDGTFEELKARWLA